jgi:anti-sigma regulatory factor (Ser/Thr protein kinase)
VTRKGEFPGNLESVIGFAAWLRDGLAAAGVAAARAASWEICLVEAFTNIVRHGYAGAEGVVRCALESEGDLIHVDLEDDAAPFDPTAQTPRERSGNEPHGMGLSIMRDAAEEIRYERRANSNRLRLSFRR